jgi:hypothetical protein
MDPRGAGCYFAAAGNVKASAGDKGTLMLWHWPLEYNGADDVFWRLQVNDQNYIRQKNGRSLWVCSQGSLWTIPVEQSTSWYAWHQLVYTWDFTVAGQGKLNVYWNGVPVGTPVTNANAPVGTAARLELGPAIGSTATGPHMIYSLGIWDDVATAEQVAASMSRGHRHRLAAGDCNGNLLLHASFDGCYDAEVAAGDAKLYATGAADRYCLGDDGLREQGRRRFLIGVPRHDLSETDRVPLAMPCNLTLDSGRSAYVTDTNYANFGELRVLAGYTSDRRVGATIPRWPLLESSGLAAPVTYRQRVHLPNSENPRGRYIRLGVVDYVHHPTPAADVFDQWGSGRQFSVLDHPDNSATQFRTDLPAGLGSGYWNGATMTMLSGNCSGRQLVVASYDATTGFITLEGSLGAKPVATSVGVVDHNARLVGCRSWGTTTAGDRLVALNMDAWLWEFHSTSRFFTELEWQFVGENSGLLLVPNFLRYERGRTALMDGVPHSWYENAACYGKPAKWEDNTLACKILLERIEVDSPGVYQVIRNGPGGCGPDRADNFMLTAANGVSTKVWRATGVERRTGRPAKNAAPSAVRADLTAPGTWRNGVGMVPVPVAYDEEAQAAVVMVVGTDTLGVARLGYLRGTWDASSGRIRWEDEPAPAGRSNPFMLLSDLRPGREPDMQTDEVYPNSVLQDADGTWSLIYTGHTSHPDHFQAYLLCGAADRWSFCSSEHWWPGNPICPIIGGPDRLSGQMNGSGAWVNRDAEWRIVENPYARDASQRYWGTARGKSVNHRSYTYASDLRPVVGVRGESLRSLVPLPHGNQVSPLAGPLVHASECAVLDQSDCLTLYSDTAIAASSGVYCWVSEDGVHFKLFADDSAWLPRQELPGEPTRLSQGRPFRLGDRRVYYYGGGSYINYGEMRLGGEAWYQLTAGQSVGQLVTSAMEQPSDGWGRLVLNAAPGQGTVHVAVLDPDTDEPVPGFSAEDCDAIGDAVEVECRWQGRPLAAVDAEYIRLQFDFATDLPNGTAPKLYAWRVCPAVAPVCPGVSDLQVEGEALPVQVGDATPEFTWAYSHPAQVRQSAYQVIVSSTKEKLDAGEGDMWDSGVVESDSTRATYAGAELGNETAYLWKVRVRSAEGVWSETW